MRHDYQIVLLAPPGYVHVAAFRELAESLHHGLRQLGQDAPIVLGHLLPGRRPIVLGANLLAYLPTPPWLPDDAIIYNLEQLREGSHLVNDTLLAVLRRHTVWDYSPRNIGWLAERGIAAQRLPLGYVPELSRIVRQPVEDIDVLFYGSLNPRREQVLAALRGAGLRVVQRFGVYGAERDALIARARLVLNLHRHEAKVFELVRVAWLLANGRAVVSEGGADSELPEDLREGIAFASADEIVARCQALLADEPARQALAVRGLAAMRRRALAPMLQAALAASPPPADAAESAPWRSLARHDPAVSPYHRIAREALLGLLGQAPRRVLDVGCGAGASGAMLKARFPAAEVWGIEPHAAAAAEAARLLDRVFATTLEDMDFVRAGLAPRSLDTVLLADVLEHMADPWQALRNLQPWLAPGARLLVSLPNLRNLGVLARLAQGEFRYQAMGILDITHLRFFTLAEARALASATGYRVESVHHALDASLDAQLQACRGRTPLRLNLGRAELAIADEAELHELCSLQHYLVLVPES